MDENKLKALEGVMAQIEKQYGKGAIMRLGQTAGDTNIEVLPTGCLSLDLAIGVVCLSHHRLFGIATSRCYSRNAVHCIYRVVCPIEHLLFGGCGWHLGSHAFA